jgi:hypothetical protein
VTKIYCIVGALGTDDVFMHGKTWWPVVFCVAPADADRMLAALNTERDALLEKLKPSILNVSAQSATVRRLYHARRTTTNRRELARAQEKWKEAIELIDKAVTAATTTMVDPFFPVDWHDAKAVVYQTIEFPDDPREIDRATTLLMRARIFGGARNQEAPDWATWSQLPVALARTHGLRNDLRDEINTEPHHNENYDAPDD